MIYLHGNCSSRLESLQCLDVLIPQNISLFSFDFSGCGLSEGEYIALGWWEREDVAIIVDFLRKSNKVSTIGLWGNFRSNTPWDPPYNPLTLRSFHGRSDGPYAR